MDEETARVGAFLASESVPVLVSIPRPRTITITNRSKVRAHEVVWPAIPILVAKPGCWYPSMWWVDQAFSLSGVRRLKEC